MYSNNTYLLKREFYNYICIFKQLLCLFDNFKLICFFNDKFLLCFLFKLIFKALCYKVVSIVCFITLSKCIIIKILINSMFLKFLILFLIFFFILLRFDSKTCIQTIVLRNFLIQIEIILRLLFCF